MHKNGTQLIMMSRTKNVILISIVILSLGFGNLFSQEKTTIKTMVSSIETMDTLIIEYYKAISSLDKANIENVNIAFECFKDFFAYKRESQRDTAALIFQYYYLKYRDIYLNEDGESVSYSEISKEDINKINGQLAKSGFVLSLISEGEELYLEPLPGFLSNQFRTYISENLLEFFFIYDIFLESNSIRYNSKNISEYILLTEKLLLKTESIAKNRKLSISKDFINKFYVSHLIRYLTISEEFGIQLDESIRDSEMTIRKFYFEFEKQNAETYSGKIISYYTKKLYEESQNQLNLDGFFYSYEYNDFSIPEIKRDLKINNILFKLRKYIDEK